MAIKIVVDSTTNINERIKDKIDYIVPLTVNFGDEQYLDGIDIKTEEFYTKLEQSENIPSTSQASPAAFDSVFEKIENNGDTAIVITIASKLSGTYQSANIAAQNYENIYVVESESVAIGSGILVEYALDLISKNIEIEEIVELLRDKSSKIRILALFDTLEYLQKGGRISKTAALAGGLLNIKPLLLISEGVISPLAKARGLKQAFNQINNLLENAFTVDYEMPIMFGYTGVSDAPIKKYIDNHHEEWNISKDDMNYTILGSVVGTHAGSGAIAIAFFEE